MSKHIFAALKADGDDAALVRATELAGLESKILAMTGKSSVSDALAELERLGKVAAESDKLAGRVQELEERESKRALDAKIAELSTAGKLPPSLHEWARSQTMESLEAFGQNAPALAPPPDAPDSDGVDPEKATAASVQLSDADKHVAQLLGVDLDELAKERAREIREGTFSRAS